MKRIIFFTLMLGLLGTGCGGHPDENSNSMENRDKADEPGYRNGTIPSDTALQDTVDSVLPPTSPPTTP